MPTTNANITFARMKVDVQRLIALAQSDALREQLRKLLPVYDILERRFDEQPPAPKSVGYIKKKPRKFTSDEIRLNNYNRYGFAAYMNGQTLDDCLQAQPDEMDAWRTGWKRAHDKQNGGETNA